MKLYKSSFRFCLFSIAIGALLVFNACNDEGDDTGPSSSVSVATDSELGSILVDGDGVTLYFFTLDVAGKSQCEGACLDSWPVFYAKDLQVGENLSSSDFGTITNADGSSQTTYKGWPLYYFAPNADGKPESPGATAGDGVNDVWFAAKPDYTVMLADAQLVGEDGKNYTSEYVEGDGSTQFLVDADGRTLYIFIYDYNGVNNYTEDDLSNNNIWPIFHADLKSLPSALNSEDFGEIEVHGEKQTTYKGWPLYYYGPDEEVRGNTLGVSVPSPGVWPIANTDTETAPEKPGPTVIVTVDDEFGSILTDGEGKTLYYFSNDADGQSNCTGGCLSAWPIFYAEEVILSDDSELSAEDFGEITTENGKQTTYKGWPLYYYAPDGTEIEAAGTVSGDGFGDVWYVAKPGYSLMISRGQLVGQNGKNYTGDYTEGDGNTRYFTDAWGRTLYYFVNDSKDTNVFTEEDFSNDSVWPIFYVDLDELPSSMNASEFGVIDVHGKSQLTFRGWPLYYYGADEMTRGNTKGVSVPTPGVWPIVNDDVPAAE